MRSQIIPGVVNFCQKSLLHQGYVKAHVGNWKEGIFGKIRCRDGYVGRFSPTYDERAGKQIAPDFSPLGGGNWSVPIL
jgi:hypothetical protein